MTGKQKTLAQNTLALLLMAAAGSAAATGIGAAGNAGSVANAGREGQARGNRIEVTGNRAENVRIHCKSANSVNINSVNVNGRALKGETVIVSGRNMQDVRVEGDCEQVQDTQPDTQSNGSNTGSGPQVNSVTIR